MKHLFCYYILGVLNFRYNPSKQKFSSNGMLTAFKLFLHVIVPNFVLIYISVVGKNGILLTIPSVRMFAFFIRIVSTIVAMNVNLLLNYFYSSADQIKLANDFLATIKEREYLNRNLNNAKSSFKGLYIVLGLFLTHHINYELNQYTYVVLYDEKWPEFTFYVVFYFIEAISVMIALYYHSVLVLIHHIAREDCDRLSNCLSENKAKFKNEMDTYWWATIDQFYNRVLLQRQRQRAFCRTNQLQLIVVALNTFISSCMIFYVNLSIILHWSHNGWIEKYKRVTECLGFFSQLGALLLICYHSSSICDQEKRLKYLIGQAQCKLTYSLKNIKRCNVVNTNLIFLGNDNEITPLHLFTLDMGFFFGTVAAIVTYLVVLFQFSELEPDSQ
ncbi:uncharacterized protein LOC131294426 [Anopheles ziemanni]|uniref:uncharacterized protein LOC131265089 n=1 Tax=Anopheles coustani TaxID=139045 RepID=UPI00265B56DB|nr:uncharacterized protein LOC131265089 [Anopheles coustani]XP_058178456.1 uncharacterized protein LOC131294426 [Anopheles ziemanni]